MNPTYLIVTTMVRDQKISDTTPREVDLVQGDGMRAVEAFAHGVSGLVPMSPYTTPSAAMRSLNVFARARGFEPVVDAFLG